MCVCAMNPYWNLYTITPHESLLNLWASKATPSSTEFPTGICGQFSCMNPYWICAHLKLVKIRHESLLNLWASKGSQNSTEFLSEICGQFPCMNRYWICGHLKLVKIRPEALLKLVHNFPRESLLNLWASKATPSSTVFLTEICTIFRHESLLNLSASKASQNSTEFLNEMCRQFCRMNPYWICQHLKLVKIQQNSAWILTEFVSIWS